MVDYANKNGPYDGVLGFSQGTVLARILLKLDEFKTPLPQLDQRIKFGILVSGIFNPEMNYIQGYDKDIYKMLIPYS